MDFASLTCRFYWRLRKLRVWIEFEAMESVVFSNVWFSFGWKPSVIRFCFAAFCGFLLCIKLWIAHHLPCLLGTSSLLLLLSLVFVIVWLRSRASLFPVSCLDFFLYISGWRVSTPLLLISVLWLAIRSSCVPVWSGSCFSCRVAPRLHLVSALWLAISSACFRVWSVFILFLYGRWCCW